MTEQQHAARAERTEPATGEDVEVVARAVFAWQYTKALFDDSPEWVRAKYLECAGMVLAALDPPGREQTLREENERLRAEYGDLAAFAETAHGDEAWTDLMGRYTAARQERDELRQRIANGNEGA